MAYENKLLAELKTQYEELNKNKTLIFRVGKGVTFDVCELADKATDTKHVYQILISNTDKTLNLKVFVNLAKDKSNNVHADLFIAKKNLISNLSQFKSWNNELASKLQDSTSTCAEVKAKTLAKHVLVAFYNFGNLCVNIIKNQKLFEIPDSLFKFIPEKKSNVKSNETKQSANTSNNTNSEATKNSTKNNDNTDWIKDLVERAHAKNEYQFVNFDNAVKTADFLELNGYNKNDDKAILSFLEFANKISPKRVDSIKTKLTKLLDIHEDLDTVGVKLFTTWVDIQSIAKTYNKK